MTASIARESPLEPDALALIEASDAFSAALYAAEHRHGVNVERLTADDARFLVARHDGHALGCVGLVLAGAQAEIKRMFVHDDARGLGIGRLLLTAIEDLARLEGVTTLRLETGPRNDAALKLYAKQGYRPCGPFGSYGPSPESVFMEKTLPPE
ncbi:GNAT family N-acetyltransferase [Phreatobacter stygius]|uniref:GNAT family N-acetyltransferase n=1 Tax=Phreatobacter stygius TaxID=1940610 RepID=A0A4D7BEW4_9HYPH|nr:GNAT family N-acetyltransferase [Phreatobacter stygius]QCI66447.1 GNAT family N-acetyltransferase [Phreatobacter stygius]